MIVTRPVATLAFTIGVLISTAAAFDNGQWNDVPDHVRSWFKSVLSPSGVHCCDIADGHRTDWEIRPAGYFIPNPQEPTGEWIPVPPGAVVHNAGNPVGEAIVWWNQVITDVDQIGIFVRCFRAGRRRMSWRGTGSRISGRVSGVSPDGDRRRGTHCSWRRWDLGVRLAKVCLASPFCPSAVMTAVRHILDQKGHQVWS